MQKNRGKNTFLCICVFYKDLILYFVQVKGSLEGFPVMLVGNKCDEEGGAREVSTKTGEALQVN